MASATFDLSLDDDFKVELPQILINELLLKVGDCINFRLLSDGYFVMLGKNPDVNFNISHLNGSGELSLIDENYQLIFPNKVVDFLRLKDNNLIHGIIENSKVMLISEINFRDYSKKIVGIDVSAIEQACEDFKSNTSILIQQSDKSLERISSEIKKIEKELDLSIKKFNKIKKI